MTVGSAYQHIEYTVDDGIATITLNRPDRLNAFTDLMEDELVDVFDLTDRDDEVRGVLLTGAGRAFCAGMDLSAGSGVFDEWRERPGNSTTGEPLRRDGGGRVTLRMFESRKPIVAAINGPAVGVGITMCLAADVRLSSTSARMGFVFGRRGLVPESCSSWFLPRIVPMPVALDWMLTGRVFDAGEALDNGLVRSVHAGDELVGAARDLLREIAENVAPVSAFMTRQMLWRLAATDHPVHAHHFETLALNERGTSADGREGIAAFLEKRPAEFPDRVQDVPDLWRDLPVLPLPTDPPAPHPGIAQTEEQR